MSSFSYNQGVFGLMLMGAKADGKLQDEEKRLIVELTSEDHLLSAEEYKEVIVAAKQMSNTDFDDTVYQALENEEQKNKIKALYRLWQLINSDHSTNEDSLSGNYNEKELSVYQNALKALEVSSEEVEAYKQERE